MKKTKQKKKQQKTKKKTDFSPNSFTVEHSQRVFFFLSITLPLCLFVLYVSSFSDVVSFNLYTSSSSVNFLLECCFMMLCHLIFIQCLERAILHNCGLCIGIPISIFSLFPYMKHKERKRPLRHMWTIKAKIWLLICRLLKSYPFTNTFHSIHWLLNPCPAEPGYTLPLQTV